MESKTPPHRHDRECNVPLRGEETVALYTAELVRRIGALSEQADMLRAEIDASARLLEEVGGKETKGS